MPIGLYAVVSNDGQGDFVVCKNGSPQIFAKLSAAVKLEKTLLKANDVSHHSTRVVFLSCREAMQNG
jgi:diacylglycerol kinase family enzyme